MPCNAGSFSPVQTTPTTATTTCTMCDKGYFQSQIGQLSCLACPQNSISTTIAATSCLSCKDTEYQCTPGSSVCLPCPKTYCGPCQLNDRSLCSQLAGICWTNYNDKCAVFSMGGDCAIQMAKICYKIWKANGINDTQCADFVNYYNYTLMQIQPYLLNAYYKEDGKSFLLEFDQDMSQTGFTDASSIFDSTTLKWLPSPPSAQWINSKTLQVSYSPDGGIMETLTILPNTLYPSYKYAQVSVTASNFPVKFLNI